jgi:selT/selW/selH-like putative selenoprotein
LAAELETALDETSHLVQSHGGVFEVERDGQLLFSKKASGRFPTDGEVLQILHGLNSGLPLEQAQAEAGRNAPHPPSFFDWLSKLWQKKSAV